MANNISYFNIEFICFCMNIYHELKVHKLAFWIYFFLGFWSLFYKNWIIKYTSNGCIEYRPGYNRKDYSCEFVAEHCTRVAFEKCSACDKGFATTHNYLCTEDENCKVLDENNKCTSCDNTKSEFFVINKQGKCVISGCAKFSYISDKCTGCNNYFYLKNNECIYTDIPYCKTPTSDSCREWAEFTKGTATLDQDIKNYKDKCITRNDEGICTECLEGYTYNESKGKCLLNNCLEVDENSECHFCEHGYLLTNYGTECIEVDSAKSNTGSKTEEKNGNGDVTDEGIINIKFNAFSLILLYLILFY